MRTVIGHAVKLVNGQYVPDPEAEKAPAPKPITPGPVYATPPKISAPTPGLPAGYGGGWHPDWKVPAPPKSTGTFVQPRAATGTPTPTAPAQPAVSVPQPSTPAPSYGLTPEQIAAEAAARIAKQRAGVKQAVDATKAGLKNTFDYNNQLTRDNRVLEDQTFKRNNNPFSGQTDYLTAQMLRNRGIQDTAAQKDYASAVAAADQKLADFDSMAPEQQQNIMNELTRLERDYGLQVGSLTGNFNGQRTLAAQGQDAQYTGMYGGQMSFPAMMQMAQLTGQLPNGQSTLAGRQANWNAYQNAVDMTGNLGTGPKQDWGQLPFQQGAPSYPAQQQDIHNTATYLGYYQGVPTMQKMLQDAQLSNMTADNARQAAAEARAAGNQSLAQKLEIWDRTGKAPEGIPGVNPGQALYQKPSATPTPKPTANEIEGEIVSKLDSYPVDKRKQVLEQEAANIISDLGITGYNRIYSKYFDESGNPKNGG